MKQLRNGLGLGILFLCVVVFAVAALAQGGGPPQGAGGGKPAGVDHKARQTRPIQLGTSGGNAKDLANGFCCSGTLGALVQIGGAQYILSNAHVFAGDVVAGGNNRVAAVGDPINQPGLVDVSCQDIPADYVASLSQWAALNSGANVDAALAQAVSGAVRTDGAILEIGTISSSTVGAVPGQRVKKSGRTTGLTRSSVDSLNATVSVQYSDECAGNTFVKTFTGQIIVKNRGSKFLNSGDSGSLMVEDVATNPQAVGLLYAGSSVLAVANPIDDVLNFFGASFGTPATVVGASATSTTTISTAEAQLQRNIARASAVQQRNAALLSSVPRGVGHAVGVEASGVVIKVLVEAITPEALRSVPQRLEGFAVVVEEVGRIVAF
ncbi:MAG: hypothetical protein HY644_03950 [Acidobacteria bacterium]|nr:hypothetical protein [Acidobacteriota bacterium]